MVKNIEEYLKNKDYLVCVDSDGCAMDTMDVKHIKCFGPCMVQEWNLYNWEKDILTRWNDINLYTLTRGINRFKGLAKALTEIDQKYVKIEGLADIVDFAENSKELSNAALKKAIENNPQSTSLKKALAWSVAVNKAINELDESEKLPYKRVNDALAYAHERADVAIVSSANLDAVLEEWQKHGLLKHVDIVLAQNCGSKAHCIGELIKKGYDNKKVVMCGDAPSDMQAAQKNNVHYYPILVKKENQSWDNFIQAGLNNLIEGKFDEKYQEELNKFFLENLGEKQTIA